METYFSISTVFDALFRLKEAIKSYVRNSFLLPIVNYLNELNASFKRYMKRQWANFKEYLYNSYFTPVVRFIERTFEKAQIFTIAVVKVAWTIFYDEALQPAAKWIWMRLPERAPYLGRKRKCVAADYLFILIIYSG